MGLCSTFGEVCVLGMRIHWEKITKISEMGKISSRTFKPWENCWLLCHVTRMKEHAMACKWAACHATMPWNHMTPSTHTRQMQFLPWWCWEPSCPWKLERPQINLCCKRHWDRDRSDPDCHPKSLRCWCGWSRPSGRGIGGQSPSGGHGACTGTAIAEGKTGPYSNSDESIGKTTATTTAADDIKIPNTCSHDRRYTSPGFTTSDWQGMKTGSAVGKVQDGSGHSTGRPKDSSILSSNCCVPEGRVDRQGGESGKEIEESPGGKQNMITKL